jgi:hypothetical protein
VAGAIALRARPATFAVMVGLSTLFAGFAASVIRMTAVEAPVIRAITLAKVGGFVESLEERHAW